MDSFELERLIGDVCRSINHMKSGATQDRGHAGDSVCEGRLMIAYVYSENPELVRVIMYVDLNSKELAGPAW